LPIEVLVDLGCVGASLPRDLFKGQKIASKLAPTGHVLLGQLLHSQQQVDRLHGSCCDLLAVKFIKLLIYIDI
ncbi:hypothetical protein QN356_19315, partial [Pseudomonas sp. CCC3.1]